MKQSVNQVLDFFKKHKYGRISLILLLLGLIAVGAKLLVLTETGDLVLADASPNAYKELGSAHVIEGRAFTAPVFADGKVYARNTKGDVVCLDLIRK